MVQTWASSGGGQIWTTFWLANRVRFQVCGLSLELGEALCVLFSGKIVITSAWAPVYRRCRQSWVHRRAGDPPKRNSYCVEKGLWLDKKMYSRLSLVHWYIRQFSVLLWPASWVGKYQFLCNFPFIKCFPAKISNPFSMWNQLCRVRFFP